MSPADVSPTGVDQVFVPSNGVITLNLNQIPAEKTRLKGFSTNRYQTSHGKSRVSGLKKAVFRVSCLVFRENLGIRAGLRRAPGNGLVSGLVKTCKAVARAALSSPAGAPPTGADAVFVPCNGVITLNLNRPPAEKERLKGFSTNRYQTRHGNGRVSGLKKAVFRVSCLVFRENLEGRDAGCERERQGRDVIPPTLRSS